MRSPLPLLGPGAETLQQLLGFSTEALIAVAEQRGIEVAGRQTRKELARRILQGSYREWAEQQYRSVEDPFLTSAHDAMLLRVLRRQKVSKILDIGCGDGAMALKLQPVLPEHGTYLGIDYVSAAIDHARERLADDLRFRFELSFAEDLRPPSGVDCVLLSLVLHFLDTHSADSLLQRLARIGDGVTVVLVLPFLDCVDRVDGGTGANGRSELLAARRYLAGDRVAAKQQPWDLRRYECYRRSVAYHCKLVEQVVVPKARVIWVAKTRTRRRRR